MALKDFMGYMNSLEGIANAQKTLQYGDEPEKRTKASKQLYEEGLKIYDASVLAGLDEDAKKTYAAQGLEPRQLMLTQDAGRTLVGKGLEGLLGEIEPKAYEEVAVKSKELEGKVKGYESVIEKGRRLYVLKELDKKYDGGKGNLGEGELQEVYRGVAEVVAEDLKKKLAKYSSDAVDSIVGLVKKVVATIGVKDKGLLAKGIKRLISDTEKELKDYESSGKTLAKYAIEGIKVLRNSSDPEENAVARSIIYDAGKKHEAIKKKKQEEAEAAKKKAA